MSGRGRAIQKYAFHLVGALLALSTNYILSRLSRTVTQLVIPVHVDFEVGCTHL